MVFGREGTHVLVNAGVSPELAARAGAPQRWRVVNAAKSRYFKLDLGEGHFFRKIGGDGGLLEYSEDQEFLVLGAGERADVIVQPSGEPGGRRVVRSLLHDRGYGSTEFRDLEDLIAIEFADLPPHAGGPLPRTGRAIEPYDVEGATRIDLELTLAQDPLDESFTYGINHTPFWKAKPIVARLGETQVWTVTNSTAWSHPLHLHGFFFMVLDQDGAPVRPWNGRTPWTSRSSRRCAWRCGSTSAGHLDLPLPHPRPRRRGAAERVHLDLPLEEFRNMLQH